MNIKDKQILNKICENHNIDDILNEISNITVGQNRYENINGIKATSYNSMSGINEMAKINIKEIGATAIFPYNKFDIRIWSNDHAPAHFHIIADDWDISFSINSGEIHKVNRIGNDKQTYSYIVKNVKRWLDTESAIAKPLTNKQNALIAWEQLHG